jgi:hypothetical protein
MAIVKEFYKTRTDGINLYRTYSDKFYMIKRTGTNRMYEEAIDVEDAIYEYEETNELIESISIMDLKAQAYDILVGEVE